MMGLKKLLLFYSILAVVVLVSMFSLGWSAALIAYSVFIISSIIFKKPEGKFFWGDSFKKGFKFGLVLITIIFLVEVGLGWIKYVELLPNTIYLLIGAVIFEVLVSLGEEMSFRGYILPNLMKSMGAVSAVVISSLLFAGLHLPSILLLGIGSFNSVIMFSTIIAASILLSLLYFKGGLKMSSGFHFSWNFFQYHIFSLRSGFGIFGLTAAKPEFTGGIAGPEAGILGLLVTIIGIFFVLKYGFNSAGFRKE
ncbi:MAG: CPBP family glutamic-type intramembrane protease [Candidatus Methanoperedens sp.]|jgi:hypothetical protein|nr:CPBP family glutamic-type intramembrane protease [Candidatus Methanoperedens sp.]PKL54012.1 MAG: hypothetical protein CVV36_04200 [Candidatus Methanoperedenaceae archaeon HGW-Methanoperedenaceae-1]